jgi:hypothetical protein
MKPGLGRIVGCPVYWSIAERNDACRLISLRTCKRSRDGGGDKELKVVYIRLQNDAHSPIRQATCIRMSVIRFDRWPGNCKQVVHSCQISIRAPGSEFR